MEGVGLPRDVAPRHWLGRGDDIMPAAAAGGAGSLPLGSAMARQRGPGAQVRGLRGTGGLGSARFGSVQPGPAWLGLARLGSVRLGAGGGSRAPARLLSSGGRGPRGCPEPRSGNGLRAVATPSPTPPPHRGVGPVRGAGGRRG